MIENVSDLGNSDLRNARMQLFDLSLPGDKRIARLILEHGVAGAREIIGEKYSLTPAEEVEAAIMASDSQFITPEDPCWPEGFGDLSTPPIGLVIRGEIPNESAIAIVGTRNPSSYGLGIARKFAMGLVDHGYCIVSGGALGIDTAAHQGAIDGQGSTVVVLAGGIDLNYPASNARLFEAAAAHGAVISEVMPGVVARPERFLTRNRLIAAMGRATVIVEAAFRSGALRTARDAAELLRPVMAVPGAITSPLSEGCHRLIAERAAEIVTSLGDLIEVIDPHSRLSRRVGLCSNQDSLPSSEGQTLANRP